MTSTRNLEAMTGDAAIGRSVALFATPAGPAIFRAAEVLFRRAEDRGQDPAEVQAARIGFAGFYPAEVPAEDVARAARGAARLALKRAEVRGIADRVAERGMSVSLEALQADGADWSGEDPAARSLTRNMPPAPDRLALTRDRDRLSLTLGAAQADGVPAEVLSALAAPAVLVPCADCDGTGGPAADVCPVCDGRGKVESYSRKGKGDGQTVNVTATLRALGWRTTGKGRQTDGARLQAALEVLQAAGARVLSAQGMPRVPARPLPARAVARMTVRRAADGTTVRALPAGAPVMVRADRPAPFMAPAQDERAKYGDAGRRAPGTPDPAPRGKVGRWSLRDLEAAEVGTRVPFMAPVPDDSLEVGPQTSARPVPGVRPGTVVGAVGARAGEGKAVRPSAPRKRSRDGGIGSPMI